ncbi:MAG: CDP-alcohol phosphatidyltransferase family protein [Deltaproteobacteria bacterium]|nr:CDP-alcohol phosphatidyltransferase family protein [Deltaproteobacteria bacterium]
MRTFTIADALTLLRFALAPAFIAAFIMKAYPHALIFFAVAGFTDLIDGTVARLCKSQTNFGAVLDPIADKLLVESCLILLAVAEIIPWWFVVIAFVRDTTILSGISYLKWKKIDFPYQPKWSSKLATLFLLILCSLALANLAYPEATLQPWIQPVFMTAFGLILLSGMQYVVSGFNILRKHRG